ncbi:Tnn [Symbiodinium natans]|uniref:Tnn protein n=1 Tax=Symbiodinium natans TaxID=878477 RepID=A0A812P428_9DINO|nr:Tnn [Symbiodinium natans]
MGSASKGHARVPCLAAASYMALSRMAWGSSSILNWSSETRWAKTPLQRDNLFFVCRYCPGDPPCGGATYGTCNRASPGDPLRRAWICECEETFNGSACDERICPVCQNNGTCVGEGQNLTAEWTCECPSTHQGDRCQFLRCPSDCSNAGDCDKFTGICACFDGYDGADCSLAPGQLVPITNAIELSLTWGLQGYEEDNNSAPEYDMGFDLYDPEVQEWILDTCRAARTSVNLLVREEMICWIEVVENIMQLLKKHRLVPTIQLEPMLVAPCNIDGYGIDSRDGGSAMPVSSSARTASGAQ